MKSYNIHQISDLRILGRTDISNKNSPLPLFWGAAAVEINVKASEVWVKLSATYNSNEPWVAIEVNNSLTNRFLVPAGEPVWFCVARGLNPAKENLISIIKDTQAMPDDDAHALFIHEIGLNDEGSFEKIPQRPLKIEFIGDSITSGEGLAGGPDEQDWIPQWFSASQTYAVKTSHLLNADWSCISECGWGLYWAWDGNTNGAIPPHYENICSVMKGDYQKTLGAQKTFNFDSGSDVVILNLGTNDNTAHSSLTITDKEYADTIISTAKNFLKTIRKHNPKAAIIWSYGMLQLDVFPPLLQNAIEQYKSETGDNKVFLLKLNSIEEAEKSPFDKGSRGHPGPATHTQAALKLSDFIKSVI